MFEIHQTVISLRGRDKDSVSAVIAEDERYVYVCDGKTHPLNNPKRKNPKHLASFGAVLEDGCFHSDRSLRKAVAKVKAEKCKE